MSYVRGQSAYAVETIRLHLTEQLTALGWFANPAVTPLPFGATTPVVIMDTLPDFQKPIAPNTVAMTAGDEGDDVDLELGANGGGLHSTQRVYFVDIFGEDQSIALRIADEVKAIVTGKFPNTGRFVPVRDLDAGHGVLEGHLLEFSDVVRTQPQNADVKRDWQVVKFTVDHQFNATEYTNATAP